MSSSTEDHKQQFILWQPSRFSSSAKTTLKRHVSWQGASLRSLSALFGRVNAKALLGVSLHCLFNMIASTAPRTFNVDPKLGAIPIHVSIHILLIA